MNTWERFLAALGAFKKAYVTSEADEFDEFRARRQRYALLWAMYEQTAYDDAHKWAASLKYEYGLYTCIRNIYNPSRRLVTFYADHLFGGQLDPEAGVAGAIPVATENESLRPAIAELWKWSRWNVNKDSMTTMGTVYGDVVLQIVDDVERQRVYLRVDKPERYREITLDPFGAVRGYVIQEKREHPVAGNPVTYTEECTREGQAVVYRTYLNGALFAWPANDNAQAEAVAEWSKDYGFIPTVFVKHSDTGEPWGWSELHTLRSKIHEVDDIASLISDMVRKYATAPWLMYGIKKPKTGPDIAATSATTARPYPIREEIPALWGLPEPSKAAAKAWVPDDMYIEQALMHLDSMLKEIERDCPELSTDIHTASGDASGRALRVARQKVIGRVLQRRANYDEGMVRANQMGVSVGGMRGYPGYEDFSLESYARGALDHTIGDRPVFEADPESESEAELAFWTAVAQATATGVSTEGYLKSRGWDDTRIAELDIQAPREETEEELDND